MVVKAQASSGSTPKSATHMRRTTSTLCILKTMASTMKQKEKRDDRICWLVLFLFFVDSSSRLDTQGSYLSVIGFGGGVLL